ncbi:MAG: hypothetical protein HUK22_06350, partial [Thermoguttaceae bacterium]|nr:hypothetical protein [Thermoguttaceae bacterium]
VYGEAADALAVAFSASELSPSDWPRPGAGTETLLAARDASGREFPILTVERPGSGAIFRAAAGEFRRLQTLSDKTIYRQFVMRTLALLTNEIAAFESAPDEETRKTDEREPSARRRDLIREETDVAARAEVLRDLAAKSGGAFLDLRDLSPDATSGAARAFFERTPESPRVASERRFALNRAGAFAIALAAFFVAWGVEFRARRD